MPSIFLSYRRSDSPDTVKLLYERLRARLPRWEIFYDHENLAPAEKFPERLRSEVSQATVVLVIIGPRWAELLRERQHAAVDHVRSEVELALQTNNSVLPVLIHRAELPQAGDLGNLRPLLERNARMIRPDPDFDRDLEVLVDDLKQLGGSEAVGTILANRYTLTAEIGAGGMGVVFLAEQKQPVQRTVAVKLIKPGMDSREVLARFDAERQALAVMDHANVARVLDGGLTPSRRPFFVMEYVKGVPITDYCDAKKLTPRERLELFIPVCNAVQHAHQKGIIHRDIKPSNVLVEVREGKPVPKVIDFGLAKALGHKLTDMTLHTALDTRVGTLEYSSPEQAAGRAFEVDTRTDIYSLGVLLYELLTGAPPFTREELLKVGEDRMRQMIRETEPPKPSKKLSSSGELPAIAVKRGVEPAALARLVKGDLDWIVMKCMEKEPSRRYETSNQLGEELQRYLSDLPVQAGPPSARYRFKKFMRRNKGRAKVAAALLLLTTAAAAALIAWQLEASTAKDREVANAAEKDRINAESDRKLRGEQEQRERDKAAAAAAQKAEQARHKQEELENEQDNLAQTLLGPLGGDEGPPSRTELRNLRQLAGTSSERIRLQFIEQALRDSAAAKRLSRRSDLAVQAAVGLNKARRERIVDLVRTKLRDDRVAPEIRQACLLVGMDLGLATSDEAFCSAGKKIAFDALAKETDPYAVARIGRAYVSLTTTTANSRRAAAGPIVDAMLKTTDIHAMVSLNAVLALLSAEMPETLAEELTGRLLEGMRNTTNPEALAGFGRGVLTLTARMGPETAARSALAAFVDAVKAMTPLALDRNADVKVLTELGRTMALLAARFPSETAVKQIRNIWPTLQHPSLQPAGLVALGRVVSAAAMRLDPAQRGSWEFVAPHEFLLTMNKTVDGTSRAVLARAFTEMIPHLSTTTPEFALACLTLCQSSVLTTTDPVAQAEIGRMVDILAARLDVTRADQSVSAMIGPLLSASFKVANPHTVALQARAIEKVAGHISARAAASLYNQLLQVLPRTKDPYVLAAQVRAVVALTERCEQDLKGKLNVDTPASLVDAMSRTSDSYTLAYLARGVAAFPFREVDVASQQQLSSMAVDKVLDGMTRANDPRALAECGQTLALLIGLMEPARRGPAMESACKRLLDAMADTPDPRDLLEFVSLRDAMTKDLPDKQRSPIAAATMDRLLDAMVLRHDSVGLPLVGEMDMLTHQITTADLITLFKSPTCVAEGRGVVLRALGRRVGPVPAVQTGCAVTVATLQPFPFLSAAVARYGVTVYPGGRLPFSDHWQAADLLRLD